MKHPRLVLCCTLAMFAALLASAFGAYDGLTWFMEVAPIFVVAPVLLATYKRYPLTTLLYVLLCLHALIMIVGGHYTYARVPLGFWIQDHFDWQRNPYDKLGHFAQGFVPALLARELMLRFRLVSGVRVAAAGAICVALAISAAYELVEWAAALALGQGADEFLGTQGDPWDTQSDMFMALIGAGLAMFFTRWHDRQLAGLQS